MRPITGIGRALSACAMRAGLTDVEATRSAVLGSRSTGSEPLPTWLAQGSALTCAFSPHQPCRAGCMRSASAAI